MLVIIANVQFCHIQSNSSLSVSPSHIFDFLSTLLYPTLVWLNIFVCLFSLIPLLLITKINQCEFGKKEERDFSLFLPLSTAKSSGMYILRVERRRQTGRRLWTKGWQDSLIPKFSFCLIYPQIHAEGDSKQEILMGQTIKPQPESFSYPGDHKRSSLDNNNSTLNKHHRKKHCPVPTSPLTSQQKLSGKPGLYPDPLAKVPLQTPPLLVWQQRGLSEELGSLSPSGSI